MQKLIDYFWPFHQIGTRNFNGVSEHMREAIRMRNRWQLHKLQPFIIRWAVLSGVIGMLLYIVSSMPNTFVTLLLGLALLTCWMCSLGVLGFMVWVYSWRPK